MKPLSRRGSPKPDGTERPLGIPTVLDRVIQQAIAAGGIKIWIKLHYGDKPRPVSVV